MLNRLKKQNRFLHLERRVFAKIFQKKIPSPGQMKYLIQFLDAREKKFIAVLIWLGLLSLIILAGRIYFFSLEARPAAGGTYIEGLIGEPRFINPVLATSDVDEDIVQLVFSGLLKYDRNLELAPDLAEKFSVSEDQKKYTLCLKKDIFWHDGERLTFEDVFFTFELVRNPALKNPLAGNFKNVNLWPIDENCFQFELSKPSSVFPDTLTLGILPKHVWESVKAENFSLSEFNLKPVGSGPFKFKSLARDKSGSIKFYTLAGNDKFYDKIPDIREMTFKFYSDFTLASEGLKLKEIEGLGSSPKEITKELAEIKNLKHYSLNLPFYTAVFFNLRQTEDNQPSLLKDQVVRKALAYLTPKEKIFEEVLYEEGEMINGPILPPSFYFNPQVKKYDYDPDLAEKTLASAGWTKNSKGFFEKDGKILEITLTTVDQPDLEKTARIVQKSWQEIGIRIKLIIMPAEGIQEIIKNRNFQCLLYGIIKNINESPYLLWHSSGVSYPGVNLTGFSNRRVDELLEKGELTKEEDKKKTYWSEFQEIIAEELPAVFLYNTTYSYLVDGKVQGINITHIRRPSDRFIGAEEWYIKVKRVKK